MSSVFGNFRSAEDVEAALLEVLQEWIPTYLRAIEEKRELDEESLPSPRSYSIVSDYDRYPQEQLPAIVVECPGMVSGSLEKDGAGYYSARYAVDVAVTVAAEDAVSVRLFAQRYGEAIRGALLQRRSLGQVGRADWSDESFVGQNDDRRRRVTCVNAFTVELRNIVSVREGPTAPDPGSTEWPDVKSVDVDVEKEN